jgi:hypothetical protein
MITWTEQTLCVAELKNYKQTLDIFAKIDLIYQIVSVASESFG